jgi:hypothetical protein
MKSQYYVEMAELERDQEEILALWDRNKVNIHDPARLFSWAYKNNPAGRGRIWLLKQASSRTAVGTVGIILRRMKIGESVRIVGRAAGLAVDKAHRSLGPALLLQKAMLNEVGKSDLSLVYTLAPPAASPLFQRLNYSNLGAMDCRRKIVGSSIFVKNCLPGLPGFALKLVSRFLDLGIQAGSRETWSRPGKATMAHIHDFDSRFDDLWSRAALNYSFTTERTSTFLRWRFSANPEPWNYVCDALCTENGGLRGYAIYYIDDHRVAHVIDMFAEDQEDAIFALVVGLARRWRSLGVIYAYLSAIGAERFFNLLNRAGFSKWRAPEPAPYKLFISPSDAMSQHSYPLKLDWGFSMADDFLDNL